MDRFFSRLTAILPAKLSAVITYFLFSSYRESFGFAFNGQCVRQSIVMEILKALKIQAIIETGTFRGSTTHFLAANSGLPVYSVELRPVFHRIAKSRLGRFSNIFLSLGDSRSFLRMLAANPSVPKTRCLFYLDAHWKDDLPLREEIELISASWKEFVIVVDDFKVEGDAGYHYDAYGEGKELTVAYLQFPAAQALIAAFPSSPSSVESGFKRGCIVLATSDLRAHLDAIHLLRPYEDLRSTLAITQHGTVHE